MKALDAESYIKQCNENNLSPSTIKAYRQDISQFLKFADTLNLNEGFMISSEVIIKYAERLKSIYAPRTAQRKFASIRAFIEFLQGNSGENPAMNVKPSFGAVRKTPETVPIEIIERLYEAAWREYLQSTSSFGQQTSLRDIAILELFFTTGLRISELCALDDNDVSLECATISVRGVRARTIHINNETVIEALRQYATIKESVEFFFVTRQHTRLSEQSVRGIINRLTEKAEIDFHIKPNTIRHTFISLIMNENVNIHDVQSMLCHGSLNATYSKSSKRNVLPPSINPRNKIKCGIYRQKGTNGATIHVLPFEIPTLKSTGLS